MSTLLEVSDVVTCYGRIQALRGVSLRVEAGRVTCLLGPNGAGKTTLMMTVTGLLKPQSGDIAFMGKRIAGVSPARSSNPVWRWCRKTGWCSRT